MIVNQKSDEFVSQFVTEEVIEIIERTTCYNKIIKSKDPENFMDIALIQWDTCTSMILCALRKDFKTAKVPPSQSLLIRICRLAAQKIYKRHQLIVKLESKTT